jgi:hypothetical protein
MRKFKTAAKAIQRKYGTNRNAAKGLVGMADTMNKIIIIKRTTISTKAKSGRRLPKNR